MLIPLKHGIKNMSLIKFWILLSKCLPLSSKDIMVISHIVVFYRSIVVISVHIKSLLDLRFQNSNRWLFNSQVSHFHIEPTEMNLFEWITDIACKSWLTNPLKPLVIWNSTWLVVVSEQIIEVYNSSWVDHPLVPIRWFWKGLMLCFKLLNDWVEIPWESQKIGVLVLVEGAISSYSLIKFRDGSVLLWGFGSCNLTWVESWLGWN